MASLHDILFVGSKASSFSSNLICSFCCGSSAIWFMNDLCFSMSRYLWMLAPPKFALNINLELVPYSTILVPANIRDQLGIFRHVFEIGPVGMRRIPHDGKNSEIRISKLYDVLTLLVDRSSMDSVPSDLLPYIWRVVLLSSILRKCILSPRHQWPESARFK